jgi:hypothetical protein
MEAVEIKWLVETADVIVKYGFLGVGLVLTLVIAPLIHKFWNIKSLTITVASFGIAFIVTWGVLDLVQRFSKRVLLAGVVLHVPNGFQAQVASDLRSAGSAYLKRENDPNNPLTNFPFLMAASQSPNCISVAVVNNDPQSETGTSGFKIGPISSDDFKPGAVVVAEAARVRGNFHLLVWHEADDKQVDKAIDLSPLADDDPGCRVGRSVGLWEWAVPSAFAQANTSGVQDFSLRLKSDDVFTRRNARIDLSKQGPQTVEIAKQLLNSEDYRLQLGALVSLSILPQQELKQLPPDILGKVHEFTKNQDPTIRETAERIEANVAPR